MIVYDCIQCIYIYVCVLSSTIWYYLERNKSHWEHQARHPAESLIKLCTYYKLISTIIHAHAYTHICIYVYIDIYIYIYIYIYICTYTRTHAELRTTYMTTFPAS